MKQNHIRENRHIYGEVFLLGFLLLGAQMILLREFLIIFNGNELVIGILFAIWMLGNAVGAWTGRFMKPARDYSLVIRVLLMFVSVYPVIAAFGIEYFRNVFFEAGVQISFYGLTGYSLLILFPLCFAGGFTFSLINITTAREPGSLQNCYSYESAGSLTGGVIVSLLFIYYLETNNFTTLEFLALIAFIQFALSAFRQRKYSRSLLYLFATFGIMHVFYAYDLNLLAKRNLFPGQEVLSSKDTPFGNITQTRQAGQLNVYLDGQLLYSENDPVKREEDVHLTLLQRVRAERVLMLGGAVEGSLVEIMKYPDIKRVDYVDQNRLLRQLASEKGFLAGDSLVEVWDMDPVYFLKKNPGKYDVILVIQPPPSGAQFNRLFTVGFFRSTMASLSPGGVLSVSLPSSRNYLSDEELQMHSSIYRSLKEVFDKVLVIPANRTYFLASDSALSPNYEALIQQVDIQNKYVNPDYLDDRLLQIRSDRLTQSFIDDIPLNENLRPVVYSIYIRHWLSYFGISFWVIPFLCILAILAYYLSAGKFPTAMFTSGLTGVSAELILIVVYQVLFGNIYLFLGIIITTFMAGLAFGSRISMQCKMKDPLHMMYFVQFFSGIYILSIAATIYFIGDIQNMIVVKILFMFTMFILASFTGLQYGVSVCHRKSYAAEAVSTVYSADLVGAAIGSLAVTVWVIPLVGVLKAVLILSGLHFLTLILIRLKRK